MAPLENPWGTNFPTSQDTGANGQDQQPTLTDDSIPGALDGDRVRVSHLNTLRNKLQALALYVGDTGSLPAGSLRDIQAQFGVTAADTTPSYLNSKITFVGPVSTAVLNPAGNEQLEVTVTAISVLGEDEIDPATSTGAETAIVLSGTPAVAASSLSGRDLQVYRNGVLMRWVAALGADKTEWTYAAGPNEVQFVAFGAPGQWYSASWRS